MFVVPGLSDFLDDVGKRIVHLNSVDAVLSIEVAGCSRWARCPACSQGSSRWHGQYRRRLKAQPSLGQTVSLVVQVRRFKCVNSKCERKTFAEQIDALAAFQQHRTTGLGLAWRAMAQALGGSAAARLSVNLRMLASRDTLFRELRRMGSEATIPPPLVVGIDDWVITRGHRYGTIVVDLVRRYPIEVLDGRESTGVADWFRRHPSSVVARDRAGAYSDAVETALSDARQGAD